MTLTVTGKHAPLAEGVLERVRRVAAGTLPFNHLDYEQEVCRSASGRTALFAWRPRHTWDADVPLVHRNTSGAVVSAGSTFPPTGSAVSDLLVAAERSPTAARNFVRSLHGTCAATHVDLATDRVRHWTAITRLQSVFWAESDDLVVAGSRAALVHLVASRRDTPAYDRLGLATLAAVGWFPNDLTPFRGVQVMPGNAELAITPESTRVQALDGALETAAPVDAPLTDEQVDTVAGAVIAALRPLRSLREPIAAGLSGGKDSRLVVAALKASGVPFATFTRGEPASPEVIVGVRVAGALGVPHRREDPTDDETTILVGERIDRTMFLWDGLRAAWALPVPGKPARGPVLVGGAGGETLRAGYNKGVVDELPLTRDSALARIAFLLDRFDGLLLPELAAAKQDLEREWVARRLRTMASQDLLDRLYIEYRTGRWAAAAQPERTLLSPHYQPLFDPQVVRASLEVGTTTRAHDGLLERLLSRFAPSLSDIPLGTGRFRFESAGARPGDEEGYRRREPIAAKVDRRLDGSGWKWDVGGLMAPTLIARVFEDPRSDGLWEVVDRDTVERLFSSAALYEHVLPVWRLASVASLVSNRWLRDPEPEVPIPVTDRLPWSDLRRRILRRVEMARDRVTTEPRPSVHAVLSRLAKRVQQASDSLEMPHECARQFLADRKVRVGEIEVSLLSLLRDRDTQRRVWETSAEAGAPGDQVAPRDDRERITTILDAIERSLILVVPRRRPTGGDDVQSALSS